MKNIISNSEKDPLGSMMMDYFNGDLNAHVEVKSTTLDMWEMAGSTMFRTFKSMNKIERKALGLCRGKILDIGAGSGCHSLYLQKKGHVVDALDMSCGCVEVMKKRKVVNVIHGNLFSVENKVYDTLLMLMNGLGICGSIDGLNLFFQFIKPILASAGQVIIDSTDITTLYDSQNIQVPDWAYPGETKFVMTYKEIVGDPFDWLYIDFETLQYYAGFHGFACELIMEDRTGKYLARLSFV
jgi:SAM-dependent methyltransferase